MRFFRQLKPWTCGCAVTRTILSHFEKPVPPESKLERILKSNDEVGTQPSEIASYLELFGLKVYSREGAKLIDLKRELESGLKPIILWGDWGGHYSIVWDFFNDEIFDEGCFLIVDPANPWNAGGVMRLISGAKIKDMWSEPNKGTKQFYMVASSR